MKCMLQDILFYTRESQEGPPSNAEHACLCYMATDTTVWQVTGTGIQQAPTNSHIHHTTP
jgi:hypothetical protein